MTYGELDNGLHMADFMCCDDQEVTPFRGTCRVQMMRDGNVYMTELKKRIRNEAIFREDNSSLSLGQTGRYYFYFSLPAELIEELPQELVRQASAIAQKVIREL